MTYTHSTHFELNLRTSFSEVQRSYLYKRTCSSDAGTLSQKRHWHTTIYPNIEIYSDAFRLSPK